MPLTHIRDLALRLSTASTIDEALEAAVETAFVLLRPSFAAVSNRFVGETMYASARVGPYANHIHQPVRLAAGWTSPCENIYENASIPTPEEVRLGKPAACTLDPPISPDKVLYFSEARFKESFPSLCPRSALLANVRANGKPVLNVGISWRETHAHDRYEREVLMTIASLLEQSMK